MRQISFNDNKIIIIIIIIINVLILCMYIVYEYLLMKLEITFPDLKLEMAYDMFIPLFPKAVIEPSDFESQNHYHETDNRFV